MKLQNVLMFITGLMFNYSTHTSSIKDDQAPVDRTEIYQRGDKTQQKFDIRQAAFAALVASKKPNAKQELLDVLDKKKSKKDARTVKPCKHPRQLIPQPYLSDPVPVVLASVKYDPDAEKDCNYRCAQYKCDLVKAVINGTIDSKNTLLPKTQTVTQDNVHTYCWLCGAHAVAVITEGHIVNLVHVSQKTTEDVNGFFQKKYANNFFHNPYATAALKAAQKKTPWDAAWQTAWKAARHIIWQAVHDDLDVPEYNPFTPWKNYDPHCTCTACQVNNQTYQDPLSVKLCECHACENQHPDKNNKAERLQKIFSEKDRKAQVQKIREHYKLNTPPAVRAIRVFDPERFDPTHPEGYVASTWQEQPDKVDHAIAARIREKIQLFNKPLRAKEQEKAALMHAHDFLSQEELNNYQLTPEEKIRPLISQKKRDAAVEDTVAEWRPLLPQIVPDLVNPLDAEEDYFKDHKNQIF